MSNINRRAPYAWCESPIVIGALWVLVRVLQVITVVMLPVAIALALALAGEPDALWLVGLFGV